MSLIDASEKPLRCSPTGMAEDEEDWPVLLPKRPSSPGTLQEMMRETGSELKRQSISGEKERYPKLGNTVRQTSEADKLPLSKYSPLYEIPYKQVSSPNLHEQTTPDRGFFSDEEGITDPFHDREHTLEPLTAINTKTGTHSKLSAAAAAVEKSRQDARTLTEPRQTRTSSLRARLSAGHLVKDGQSKVVGFTDFTAPPESGAGPSRRNSLRARKETQLRRSTTPPVVTDVIKKPSRESIGSSRAPAKFVAGSRRPVPPRRPGSRGSLLNDNQVPPSPPAAIRPPSRSAPRIPVVIDGQRSVKKLIDKPHIEQRKSSIPVPRPNTPKIDPPIAQKLATAQVLEKGQITPKRTSRDEFSIFQDHTSAELIKELENGPVIACKKDDSAEELAEAQNARALEAIPESPQQAYQLKRLSMKAPEYGPSLKISPSAERFIMGPNPTKENQTLGKKKSKELSRASVRLDTQQRNHNPLPASAAKKRPDRPLSVPGLPQSSPRVGLIDPKDRERKVKSADISSSLALDYGSGESTKIVPDSGRLNTGSSTKASSSSDPFFDALEEPQQLSEATPRVVHPTTENIREEAPWISPMSQNSHDTSITTDGALMNNLQSTNLTHTVGAAKPEMPLAREMGPSDDTEVVARDFAKQAERVSDISSKRLPVTPIQSRRDVSSSSPSYPPRNSSRMAHPHFPSPKQTPASPRTSERVPVTPPKEFVRRQNNLGSTRGHASSQLDLGKVISTSKRDSIARDSAKSQGSLSKGMLSNFRGLFHKRSSEPEPLLSSKKIKQQKASVASNGSSFPPISTIHPIHRPTLASQYRSSTPRSSLTPVAAAPTASLASPLPSELSATTTLAMSILESARAEHSSPRKERLLELGKIMVDAITQARDAEKAMEEARQAARKAEVAYAMCKGSLGEVVRCVEGWKGEVA